MIGGLDRVHRVGAGQRSRGAESGALDAALSGVTAASAAALHGDAIAEAGAGDRTA
jgi:hypothetical protein